VVSAFPAELAPLVAAAKIEATVQVDGRSYYLATLDGMRVVLGLTGVGMVNAAERSASVIRAFAPEAIIFSGVAGSRYRIGDVVVVRKWTEESGGKPIPVNRAMLALTRRAVRRLPAPFQNCAGIPPMAPTRTVCLPYAPTVVFGQTGQTGDPYMGHAIPCVAGGNELVGCDLPAAPAVVRREPTTESAASDQEAEDEETAVVAGLAKQGHVPFIAMRAVSDGAGDPLGDRGFPTQFLDYYRLAAGNAALVTRALLADVARLAGHRRGQGVCHRLAQRR